MGASAGEQEPDSARLAFGGQHVADGDVRTEGVAASQAAHGLAPHGDVQVPFERGEVLVAAGAVQEVAASRGGRPPRAADRLAGRPATQRSGPALWGGAAVSPVPGRAVRRADWPGRIRHGSAPSTGRAARPTHSSRSVQPSIAAAATVVSNSSGSPCSSIVLPSRGKRPGGQRVGELVRGQPQDSRCAVRCCGDVGGGSLVERTYTHHRGQPDGGGLAGTCAPQQREGVVQVVPGQQHPDRGAGGAAVESPHFAQQVPQPSADRVEELAVAYSGRGSGRDDRSTRRVVRRPLRGRRRRVGRSRLGRAGRAVAPGAGCCRR